MWQLVVFFIFLGVLGGLIFEMIFSLIEFLGAVFVMDRSIGFVVTGIIIGLITAGLVIGLN